MTTIKTWQTRKAECLAEFPHSEAFDSEHMDAEITDLRAAIERKDALLRECLTSLWFDVDGSRVRVQIKKELS
jgi:hypothetical protein